MSVTAGCMRGQKLKFRDILKMNGEAFSQFHATSIAAIVNILDQVPPLESDAAYWDYMGVGKQRSLVNWGEVEGH